MTGKKRRPKNRWDDEPDSNYEYFKPVSDTWRYEDPHINMDKYEPKHMRTKRQKMGMTANEYHNKYVKPKRLPKVINGMHVDKADWHWKHLWKHK